jgi:hypothetical protein
MVYSRVIALNPHPLNATEDLLFDRCIKASYED